MQRLLRGRSWRVVPAVLAGNLLWATACSAQVTGVAERDPLRKKIRGQLRSFVTWLERNDARGYVGEIGWPDNSRGDARDWNRLARDWFDLANQSHLSVSAWATGEWWDDYRLSIYEAKNEKTGVDTPNTQARVLEAAAAGAGTRIGINVNGGEFGSPITSRNAHFSNENPGAYNTRYHYDSRATFDYLGSRKLDHVRIPFRWERIQPRLGGPLDKRELARLRAAVGRAWEGGLRSILDVHNYGAYYLHTDGSGHRTPIGSRRLPISDFADLWRRLSKAFESDKRVLMYALMAEPYALPSLDGMKPAEVWEVAAQRALSAVRNNGDRKLIAVPGYGWDALQVFMDNHPKDWIKDPADNVVYEVHHYWDGDHSGDYARSYEAEMEAARRAGW